MAMVRRVLLWSPVLLPYLLFLVGLGVPWTEARAEAVGVRQVTFAEVLKRARQNPPVVLAALATLERIAAQEAFARGAYIPRFSFEAGSGVQYDNRNTTPNKIHVPDAIPPELRDMYIQNARTPRYVATSLNNYGNARFDLAFFDLARRHAIAAAGHNTDAQRASYSESQRAATQAAAELYLRSLAAGELVADAALTETRRNQQLEGISGLVKAGVRPSVDAKRAEVEALAARFARQTREIEEQASFAALAVALGLPPSQPVQPASFRDELLPAPLAPLAAATLAAQQRPDVRRLEAALQARRADHRAAIGARLPTLGLVGSGTVSDTDILHGTGIQGPAGSGSGYMYLRWGALDPAIWRRAQVTRAAVDEAQRQLEAALLSIQAEAVDAAYNVQRTAAQLEQATQVLAAAAVTRVAQNERYRAGVASLLDLLDAEGVEQNARRQRIESLRDHRLARVRLLALCGQIERLAP